MRSTGFLDDLDLQLSPALNCLIGARGTGKTSLLELIRFATGREDETPRTDRSLAEIVPAALGDGGSVELDITTPLGQRLTVTRSVTGAYTVDDRDTGEPADVDWPPVGVYSFDIFSQNQLEDIAMDPRARIRMLDLYSGAEIDSLQRRNCRPDRTPPGEGHSVDPGCQ